MRREDVRRRALLAAAKVAFAATAGCATEPLPAAPPRSTSVTTGPGGCTLPTSDAPTDAESSCCVAAAGAVVGDRAGTDDKPDPRAPREIVACCTHVLFHRNQTKRSPSYDSCCAVLGTMSGACTPWGPPVPPRMRAA